MYQKRQFKLSTEHLKYLYDDFQIIAVLRLYLLGGLWAQTPLPNLLDVIQFNSVRFFICLSSDSAA